MAPGQEAVIRGLAIVDLGDGAHKFKIVPMAASAQAGNETGRTRPKLLGPNTSQLSQTVASAAERISRNRPDVWSGRSLTVEVTEALHRVDAQSAGLGIQLSLEALAAGWVCDPEVAVTGTLPDSPDDSRILAVDSLGRKIRESIGGAKILVVPAANREDLADLLLTDGIGPWLTLQIFTAETLEEARRLAPVPELRDALLNEALRLFGEARSLLGVRPRMEVLRQPDVQLRLRKVVELEPGHASARMLLAIAEKRMPAHLSVVGSLRLLDDAQAVLRMEDPSALFQAATTINRQRPILAPEVQLVWDALEARLEAKRRLLTGFNTEWQIKAREADASFTMRWAALAELPEVQSAQERLDREP